MTHGTTIRFAGPGTRFLAMIVDALLLLFVFGLARFTPVLVNPARYLDTDTPHAAALLTPATLLIGFVLAMLITALLWNRFSGTPGKLLLGIRVIALPGAHAPSLPQGMLRFGAYILSLLPALLGFAWSFWDTKRQGFHDKLSHTAVIIDDESAKTLQQLIGECR